MLSKCLFKKLQVRAVFIIDNSDSKTFVSMYYSKKDKLNKKERNLNMCLVKRKKWDKTVKQKKNEGSKYVK